MSSIKYYALRIGEEPPEEFIVIRHVDGEPEFVTSYINSTCLSYENGVLLKMHERNDALRAENAKLRKLVVDFNECLDTAMYLAGFKGFVILPDQKLFDSLHPRMCELGIEEDK